MPEFALRIDASTRFAHLNPTSLAGPLSAGRRLLPRGPLRWEDSGGEASHPKLNGSTVGTICCGRAHASDRRVMAPRRSDDHRAPARPSVGGSPGTQKLPDMLKRSVRTFARIVGLVFALLGLWVLVINLVDIGYSGALLASILIAALLGGAGGVVFLLSFDGPDRWRTRGIRIAAWLGMLALALLPTGLSIRLVVLVVLAVPTLFLQPDAESRTAAVP
jgi:hypothetical protein